MPDETQDPRRLERVRALMRQLESEPQIYDPDLERTYAGEWVIVYQGQVVAHGKKGSELVQADGVENRAGARLIYIPTSEQQDGVWLLCPSNPDG